MRTLVWMEVRGEHLRSPSLLPPWIPGMELRSSGLYNKLPYPPASFVPLNSKITFDLIEHLLG